MDKVTKMSHPLYVLFAQSKESNNTENYNKAIETKDVWIWKF